MRAIREPAPLYGGEVSRELAERLIADAGGGQDQLPLIQHGLMLLWRRTVGAETDREANRRAIVHDPTGLAEPFNSWAGRPKRWHLDVIKDGERVHLATLLSRHADAVMEIRRARGRREAPQDRRASLPGAHRHQCRGPCRFAARRA